LFTYWISENAGAESVAGAESASSMNLSAKTGKWSIVIRLAVLSASLAIAEPLLSQG
jgi:hypothetical protein